MTITKIDGMLKSRVPGNESRDVYGSGAIRDVFLAAITGKHTLRELLSMSDKSTIHDFLFGKHLSASGRSGWHWSYTIGDVLLDGPLGEIKTTDARLDKRFAFVNAKPIDAMVNSKFHRGSGVTLADVIVARNARLTAAATPAAVVESEPLKPVLMLGAASDQIIDVKPETITRDNGVMYDSDGVVIAAPKPNRKTRRTDAAIAKRGEK